MKVEGRLLEKRNKIREREDGKTRKNRSRNYQSMLHACMYILNQNTLFYINNMN